MASTKGWFREHQGLAFTLVIVVALGFSVIWAAYLKRPDPRVAALKARGYPTTTSELAASYPAVPAESNSALLCLSAFAAPAFPGNSNNKAVPTGMRWLPEVGEPLSSNEIQELRAIVASAKPVIDQLKSLPPLGPARYPVDFSAGFNALLPHLGNVRNGTALLCMESALLANEGRASESLESLEAARRVAATIQMEPTLMSQLVWLGTCHSILRHAEFLVNMGKLSTEELRILLELVRSMDVSEVAHRALVAERVMGLSAFDDPLGVNAVLGGGTTQQEDWQPAVAAGLLRSTGILKRDKAFYLTTVEKWVSASALPPPGRWQRAMTLSSNPPPPKIYILSRLLSATYPGVLSREARCMTLRFAAEAALTMRLSQMTNSSPLPDSLRQLAPGILPTVPLDPFTGSPLVLKHLTNGFVVYGVGSDFEDDGGLYAPAKKSGGTRQRSDICFTVITNR